MRAHPVPLAPLDRPRARAPAALTHQYWCIRCHRLDAGTHPSPTPLPLLRHRYVAAIIYSLAVSIKKSYDARGLLRRGLVLRGGIPEAEVMGAALGGFVLLLLLVLWAAVSFYVISDDHGDALRLITSIVSLVISIVRGVVTILKTTRAMDKEVFRKWQGALKKAAAPTGAEEQSNREAAQHVQNL